MIILRIVLCNKKLISKIVFAITEWNQLDCYMSNADSFEVLKNEKNVS